MTKQKIGKMVLSDEFLTAERSIRAQDTDAILASSQDIQNNAVDKASMYFPASADKYLTLPASPASLAIGASNCTDIFVAKIDSALQIISRLSGTNFEQSVSFNTDGTLRYRFIDSVGDTPYFNLSIASYGSINAYALTRTHTGVGVSTLAQYKNGLLIESMTATERAPSGTPATNTLGFSASSISNGTLFRYLKFNYALSAEKIAYYSAGGQLLNDDIGGTMVPINSVAADQNFSSDTGWWTLAGPSITAGVLRFNAASTASVAQRNGAFIIGRRYRIDMTISNYVSGGIAVLGATGFPSSTAMTANGTYSWEFIADSTQLQLRTYVANNTFDVDNVVITPLGCLAAFEPDGITNTGTWLDTSGNLLHGVVTGTTALNKNNAVSFRREKTVTVTGLTTSPSITIEQVRAGNMVTIRIPSIGRLTKDTGNGVLSFAVDTEFSSGASDNWMPQYQVISNTPQLGLWRAVNGTVQMSSGAAGGSIAANTTNVGWDIPITITYKV